MRKLFAAVMLSFVFLAGTIVYGLSMGDLPYGGYLAGPVLIFLIGAGFVLGLAYPPKDWK